MRWLALFLLCCVPFTLVCRGDVAGDTLHSYSLWLPPPTHGQSATTTVESHHRLTLSHRRSVLQLLGENEISGLSGGNLPANKGDRGRRRGYVSFGDAEQLLKSARPTHAAHLADWLAARGMPVRWRGQRHGPANDQIRLLLRMETADGRAALAVFRPGPPGLAELGGCAMLRVANLAQCPPIIPFNGRTDLVDLRRLPSLLHHQPSTTGNDDDNVNASPNGTATTFDLARWRSQLGRAGSLQWLIQDDNFRLRTVNGGSGPTLFEAVGTPAWRSAWKLTWFLVGTYDCGLKHVLIDGNGVTWAVDVGKVMTSWQQWEFGHFPWFRVCQSPAAASSSSSSLPPFSSDAKLPLLPSEQQRQQQLQQQQKQETQSLGSSKFHSFHVLATRVAMTLFLARQYLLSIGEPKLAPDEHASAPSFAQLARQVPFVDQSSAVSNSVASGPGWALAPFHQLTGSTQTVRFARPVAATATAGSNRFPSSSTTVSALSASQLLQNTSFFAPWSQGPGNGEAQRCHAALAKLESRVLLGHMCSTKFDFVRWSPDSADSSTSAGVELWTRPRCSANKHVGVAACWRPPATPDQWSAQLSTTVMSLMVPLLSNRSHTLDAFRVLAQAGVDQERTVAFFDRIRQVVDHQITI